MDLSRDFLELLASFHETSVEALIIGGYAVAFHGAPRATGDIDLWVRPTRENAARVLEALRRFGFGGLGLSEEDFTRPDHVVQLGRPPQRVDILTAVDGATFDDAWRGRVETVLSGVPVAFLGREDLLRTKRAAGRPKDLADLDLLGESPGQP